jgi:L-fuconolactonase
VDNRESEGILANSAFREGAKVLSQKGLSLDVMLAFPQMPEVADFARAVPDLQIIRESIDSLCSGPSRISAPGPPEAQRS